MHIDITDQTTLGDIREAFSDFYPFLKIEFYHKGHKIYEASDKSDVIDPAKTIGEIRKTHLSALMEIQPLYRVADVETEFQMRFGLPIQVFWKDKEEWRQTTGMDDFTLKELNEMGRNSSDEFIVEDYEEGFEDTGDKPEIVL